MLEHAMIGLLRGALDGREPCAAAQVQRLLERSWRQTISPQVWRTSLHGPVPKTGVGLFDASLPSYCSPPPAGSETPTIDEWQSNSGFAHAGASRAIRRTWRGPASSMGGLPCKTRGPRRP